MITTRHSPTHWQRTACDDGIFLHTSRSPRLRQRVILQQTCRLELPKRRPPHIPARWKFDPAVARVHLLRHFGSSNNKNVLLQPHANSPQVIFALQQDPQHSECRAPKAGFWDISVIPTHQMPDSPKLDKRRAVVPTLAEASSDCGPSADLHNDESLPTSQDMAAHPQLIPSRKTMESYGSGAPKHLISDYR